MIDPESSRKITQYTPFVVVVALVFLSHRKPVVALEPNESTVGKHRSAAAMKPIRARDAAV